MNFFFYRKNVGSGTSEVKALFKLVFIEVLFSLLMLFDVFTLPAFVNSLPIFPNVLMLLKTGFTC